ncbi:MAG: ABC transporter permease, partial [Chloroflexota bacterium]
CRTRELMGTTLGLINTLPIVTLTLLQFSGGRAIRAVAFFSLLPVLFSLIYLIDSGGQSAGTFMNDVFQDFGVPVLVPLVTLILATGAIGDEIEDRTLAYLVLKPMSRFRIVAEKFFAVVIISTLALWLGMILTWLIAARGSAPDSVDVVSSLGIAIFAGVLGYGAAFLLVSLIIPRALVVGIIYTIIWEGLLSRPDLLPGAWVMSIRHYVLSIQTRILGDSAPPLDSAVQLFPAIAFIVLVVAVSLALTTLRLRTMNIE